jgi:hypothetical protein
MISPRAAAQGLFVAPKVAVNCPNPKILMVKPDLKVHNIAPQGSAISGASPSPKEESSMSDRTKFKKPPLEAMDRQIATLYQQWLVAFENTQSAEDDEESATALARIESRIAGTPAEGLRGLVVKFGLHQFLNDQADAASIQVDSAYCDLVRLTGHDPAAEISARFEKDKAAEGSQ